MNKYHLLALACMSVHAVNGMEKEKIATKSDWDAKKYQGNSELQYKAAMGALSRIEFKGNERVLDIGCGDGRVTKEIANRVPRGSVEGIDVSPKMIEHARVQHKQDNLSFDLQDIAKSKCDDQLIKQFKSIERYNLVTAFASLSWVKDQQQVFTNIARLLTWDGKLRAGLAHEDSAYLRARYAMHSHDTWKEFFVDYEVPYYPSNEDKVKQLLKTAGLIPEFVGKIEAPHAFATRQDFINWMRAIPVQIDRVPQERQEEFLNDIVTEYLKEVPQKEDGSIEVIISALAVRAHRDIFWF